MRRVTWHNILAMILAFALLVSSVPMQVFALDGSALEDDQLSADAVVPPIPTEASAEDKLREDTIRALLAESYVISEDESRRGENYKEYILSNGIRLATVYPSAVHYEVDGEWREFDNTLISAITEGRSVYTNTAGPWDIQFPQNLSSDSMIGITMDGYTVQFGMTGELRTTGELVVASAGPAGEDTRSATLSVSAVLSSTAQIEQIDPAAARAAAQYPETVLDKLNSRLSYANIFPYTNMIYDLQGSQLKESIVLQQYDASLRGYRYNLDVGGLVPVLGEEQQIDLCDPATGAIVLTMPAPYMVDENGNFNDDVEVSLVRNGDSYLLSYYLPTEWLAEEDRAWPVILDPIVTQPGRYDIVDDRTFRETKEDSVTRGVIVCGCTVSNGKMRFLMRFMELPELTSADTIINATISLKQAADYDTSKVVEVHKVTGSWESTENLTWSSLPAIDDSIEDYAVCQLAQRYEWNITDIVRGWYDDENTGMMFKASDEIEKSGEGNWVQFYSSDYGTSTSVMPMLTITYWNTNGLENYWNYSSVSANRAGAGYVNRFTGNLTWVRSDLGFDGNRMPVSISHIYNSNDANNNRFGMGYGWRTNYNQTVTKVSTDLYAWEDGDGTNHYFVPDGNGTYADLDGLDLTLTVVTSDDFILTDMYGNTSEFTDNKLTRMVNNQATESDIEITYNDSGLISQVADGVGRKYNFVYADGLLSRISYTSEGNAEITYITYSYSNGDLIRIIDRDSSFTAYSYSNHLLVKANDVGGYYITCAYSSGTIKRVTEVKEYYESTVGSSMTLTYSTHCTEVKDHKDNYTRYQFNDWGDLVATHDSYGHTQYTKYTLNDVDDPIPSTAEVHQVSENSNEKGTAINHFADSSFEGGEKWTSYSGWYVATISTDTAYLGNNSMKMSGATNGGECRVIGPYIDVYDGETYTFSTYVLPEEGAKASIAFVTSNYTVLSSSIIEEATNDWVRLQVSYTNEGSTVVRVFPHIAVNTGVMYVDCVQLEKAEAASDYNLLENGEFKITISEGVSYLEGWTESSDCTTEDHYYGSAAANSALDTGVYHMKGNPSADKYLSQTVTMNGETGDTFVLAGWARANAVSCLDGREFGLKLIFHNTDGTTTEYFASFDPEISFRHWQYAALTAIATKVYNTVTVQVVYSQQANVAYFDGIQLYADRIGTSYSYDSNKNLISETNILGQTTTYEYYENGVDLKSVDAPVGSDVSYEYDTYHNVTKVTEKAVDPSGTQYTTSYTYAYDVYGNITSTTVTQGSYVQKSVTTYSSDGNYAVTATDGNGDTTTYGYDTDTGVLEWVQYPEDTDGTENTRDTRTYYEYDNMYRLEQISTDTDKNVEMSAAYSYENDLLETLTTQTTTYSFGYGKFDLRTSVTIGTQLVASYTYTDDESHYLQRLDYSNGDSVEYTYDNLGRVTAEKYYENNSETASRTITYTYDNGGALAITEDSATEITTICYYDFAGRIVKLVETNDIDYYHVSMYGYDGNGNVYAMLEYINGEDFCTEFDYDYKNRIASVTTMDAERRYSYDSFDRVTRRVTSKVNGETTSTVLLQNISYLSVTVEGQTLTTNRVEQIATIANNYRKTYTYTYDGNGNITSVSDGTYTTTYEYDSANQLIRENNQAAGKTWVWTYDGAGNILSKGECSYTTALECTVSAPIVYRYGKNGWGDVLVGYGNKNLSYDSIGNLLRDGTYTYTWEQGRQLARMSRGSAYWEYTYDSNGMRTGRTSSSGMAYTYVYNGSQLSMMTCGTDVLYFSYDAAGTPMTVRYNGTTYYYVTNLQGDVIAILNGSGTAVVQYTYDAWGALLSSTDNSGTGLGARNPLRYRGYVYDVETGLYYLQSRYYNPTWGRFINADGFISTGQGISGSNMYIYCLNNPVCYTDNSGYIAGWAVTLIIAAVILAIGIDHGVAKNAPDGYAYSDEMIGPGMREKQIYISGNGFACDINGLTLCDLEAGLLSVTYDSQYADFDVLKMLTASATAEVDWSNKFELDISGLVSAASTGAVFTLPFFDGSVVITWEHHFIAAGAGWEFDTDEKRITFTPPSVGVVSSFGFDFDF